MPRVCLSVLLRVVSAVSLACMLAGAHAVEIGDITVRSFIGQPLVADIELTGVAGDAAVIARLAHPDVFEASNIGMHPVLPSVRMSVMRRDGRQFLHITSIAPVQTQYVHLFLDLADGGRRSLRAASLPLVTDPRPPPPPVAVPAPLAPLAQPVAAQPALKLLPTPTPTPAPKSLPKTALATLAAPAAAICPKPRFTDDEIRSCATRDYKNAMLSAQIVELEEKVKALQAALDTPATPEMPATPAIAQPAAHVNLSPPPIKPASPAAKEPADDGQFPWVWLGVAIAALAVVAGAVVMVLKRRGKGKVAPTVEPKNNMMGRLKDAMQRDNKPAATEDA